MTACALLAAVLVWAGEAGGAAQSSDGDAPVEIHGRSVEYRGKEGRAVFSGGVIVTRGDSTLKCDALETLHGSVEAIARGNVRFSDRPRRLDLTCEEARYTHGLRNVIAVGNCQLVAGEGAGLSVVTSEAMELRVEDREAIAKGSVRIVQGDAEAKCEEARLFGAEDRLVLRGRPLLLRPPHRFECDELESFFREGRTILKGTVKGSLHAERLEELR